MVLHTFYFLCYSLEVEIKQQQTWKLQRTLLRTEGLKVVVSLSLILPVVHSFKES